MSPAWHPSTCLLHSSPTWQTLTVVSAKPTYPQAAFEERAKARAAGKPWVDPAAFHTAGSRFPGCLPEGLRPRAGGIQPHHLRVYEDFTRVPRTAPPPVPGPPGAPGAMPGAVPAPAPGVAPAAPGAVPQQGPGPQDVAQRPGGYPQPMPGAVPPGSFQVRGSALKLQRAPCVGIAAMAKDTYV